MSALAIPTHRALRFWQAPIGKKAVMALTGVILFGYLVAHLLGNLQIYSGPDRINHYATLLHANPGFLWVARLVLLASVVLHIVASIQLTLMKQQARPVGYTKKESIISSYASRTMMWSGPIIAAFVVFHVADLTFGSVNPRFQEADVYHNVVASFSIPAVAIFYIVAMLLLGMHLYHGLWSMFQSLGINHPRYNGALRRFAQVFTFFIVGGNISIPLSVMTGIIPR